jgi:hypothetical protein
MLSRTVEFCEIGILSSLFTLPCQSAFADVACPVSNWHIEQFEDGTSTVRGTIGGNPRWLYLCTGSGTTVNCDSAGTARNFALALTAYTTGKTLLFYYANAATCAVVADWTRPTSVYLLN